MNRLLPHTTAILVAMISFFGTYAPRAHAADLPEIVTQLPSSFDAAIVVPSLKRLDANASQLVTAMQITNLSSIEQLLTVMGARNGLDLTRGAAAVLDLPDAEGGTFGMTFVLPVSDYNAFASNFVKDLDAQRPGISRFEYFGREYFIKSLDGRSALIGETPESVRTYEPAGNTEAISSLVGGAGVDQLSGCDLGLVVDVARSKDAVRGVLDSPRANAMLAMFPASSGLRDVFDARVEELLRDGRGLTLAMTPGQLGLNSVAAVNYKEGTPTHALCENGSGGKLIEPLPAGTTYLTGGADLAHPAMAEWFDGLASESWLQGVRTVAFGAYMPSPPFLGRGAANKMVVRYESEDPSAVMSALSRTLKDEEATGYRGEYAESFKTFDEVPIDGWSYFQEGAEPFPTTVIGAQNDFLGASAVHEGAGYVFTTRDPGFIRAALGTDGTPRLLESDRVMQQVRSLLPEGASLELAFSMKPLLDEFASVIRMFSPGFQVLPQVPPAAMNVTIGGGSAVGSAFVPAPTLSHAIELFQIFVMPTLR